MRQLFATLLIACSAAAQGNGSIEGPMLGLVFNSASGAVQWLEGIPGSARLGQTLDGGADLLTAAVASTRGYAVGLQKDGSAVLITAAGGRRLEGSRPGAAQAIVSPRGTAAALVSDHLVQVFTGMPNVPELRRTVRLEEPAAVLAISDDGEILLAVARGRRGGDAVYAHRASGSAIFYRAARISAVAFVPGQSDVLVAEPTSVKLVRQDLGEQAVGGDPEGRVTAAAASTDGSRVFVASSSGRVAIHDLRSGVIKSARCACTPRTLAPLDGSGVFRLNDPGDGPMWVLDASGDEPRIAFVAASGENR